MIEENNFEERKRRYLESVVQETIPADNTWWQYPPPVFYTTRDYADKFPQAIDTSEPATFRKPPKNALIGILVTAVAGTLLYVLGNKSFGLVQLVFLAIILLLVIPPLLDNKPKIIIGSEGIWLPNEQQNIPWKNIVETNIKEIQQEHPSFLLVVHYYNALADQFSRSEIDLEGITSPAVAASTLEAFRRMVQVDE